MILKDYIPVNPVNKYFDNFVSYKDEYITHEFEHFFPDRNVTLIINLTCFTKFIYDNISLIQLQSFQKTWFSVYLTNYFTFPSAICKEMFIVNLKKGMEYAFVYCSLLELQDSVINSENIFGQDILILRDS